MKKINILLLILIGLNFGISAQMVVGNQKLYGNEWIDYTQIYVKIPVAQDGIYRLTASALQTAGIPLSSVAANRFQLFKLGQEVPIFTSTEAVLGSNDYIEFFGEKNRGELDAFMYKNQKSDMLNPEHSQVTDTAVYFLTWRATPSSQRFQTLANNLTNLPAKEPWFWHNETFIGIDRNVAYDISGGSAVYLPEMNTGEGFGTEFGNNRTITLYPQFIADGQGGKLSLRWTGNYKNHYTNINVSGTSVGKDTAFGYIFRVKNYELTAAQIKPATPIQIVGGYEAADNHSLGVASLEYARQFNFGGKNQFIFKIAASADAKYLEITNFLAGTTAPILYDITNKTRIVTTLEGGLVKVALPPSTAERTLVLVASNGSSVVSTITPTTFVDLRPDGGNYIMIASPRFLNDGTGKNYVQEYADYRSSTEGGSFKTKVIDIQQVHDQFGYGVNRHPLCLRNFSYFVKKNWANPQYLVLVGKAKEFPGNRYNVPFADVSDLPSWGYPSSDVMFVTNDSSIVPIMPVGRIPLSAASEMKIYLDKVKEHENVLKNAPQTLEARQWMKNVMHLSGGGNEGPIIKVYMKNFGDTLQSSKAGLNVTTFYKTSLDPVQIALNDQIFNLLNKGVSLINFYGHSATATLDFDINNPDNMSNKGKYPLFVALGCSAGNCHQQVKGTAEYFIFYKDKGMSAFAGTTGSSFLNSLNRFANVYYSTMSTLRYGESLGDVLNTTFSKFSQLTVQNDLGLKSAIQEFQITGDPALRLFAAPGPDFLPAASSVKIEPSILTAQLDSFAVTFTVSNIGINIKDSMTVLIRLQLPNNTFVELAKKRISTPQYQSTFTWRVQMPKESVAGSNRLHIFVDSDNNITELPSQSAKVNNELVASTGEKGVPFYILDNNVRPVYPAEFAIVNKVPLVLKASTSNALAKPQNYYIEIDTTLTFNSPLKKRTVINQLGGVLKWQPEMNWTDKTVYYWRTAADSTAGVGYAWQNSSFVYLKDGSEGWNQSHYYQWLGNKFTTLKVNDYDRRFDFEDDTRSIDLRYYYRGTGLVSPKFFINNQEWDRNFGYPSDAGLFVVVFDKYTGKPWTQGGALSEYGKNPANRRTHFYIFNTNSDDAFTGRKGFIDFIGKIPERLSVLVFAIQQYSNANYRTDLWAADSTTLGTNIFKVLEQQGATKVRALTGTDPYSFAFQKNVKPLAEKVGSDFDIGAPISFLITVPWYEGKMVSKIVGPAREWQSLELNYIAEQTTPKSDSLYFDVIGLTADMRDDTLLLTKQTNNIVSLSTINAKQYPYLKLQFYGYDNTQRSAPQLNYWRVLYKGTTELAVNPNAKFTMYKDTLQQGDQFKMEVNVENISDADSVLVKWTIRNEANVEVNTFNKYAPLSKSGNLVTNFTCSTKDLGGKLQIFFEVNPNMAQPEQYTFNNYLQTNFYVEKDKRNPLLDVMFDGIRIMNNDIVSPKPLIVVELRDENKFLALNDTALFKLYVQSPSGLRRQIFFNDPSVKFNPAIITATGMNKATIEYRPIFTVDGTYQLIVKAKDISDNTSGDMDYSIAFNIITKSSISNVLNYPNPFSTRTQFIYTLTGETPPTYFKIQIMSVSGKVVREITQDEIGSMKIGTHRTDYVWDGTDEYGNKLANGVYLYRVIAKNADGKAFESFDNGTNDYFKKGIGKLVIVR
jgi:Peptidase family C25